MPPKGHAVLSASSSYRWLHCPPSARLCESYDDKGSDYAAEGTEAHALCEFKLRKALGGFSDHTVGVLGLSFKPNTDDIREAPALEIIHLLINEGATVKAYDPQAMSNVAEMLPALKLCTDPYQVAEGADALILTTEWNEFKQIDFERIYSLMNHPIILDGRNLWDPAVLREIGFTYYGIGRAAGSAPENGA